MMEGTPQACLGTREQTPPFMGLHLPTSHQGVVAPLHRVVEVTLLVHLPLGQGVTFPLFPEHFL